MKQCILCSFFCLNLLQVYLPTFIKKITYGITERKLARLVLARVGFQMILTDVSTNLSEFALVLLLLWVFFSPIEQSHTSHSNTVQNWVVEPVTSCERVCNLATMEWVWYTMSKRVSLIHPGKNTQVWSRVFLGKFPCTCNSVHEHTCSLEALEWDITQWHR